MDFFHNSLPVPNNKRKQYSLFELKQSDIAGSHFVCRPAPRQALPAGWWGRLVYMTRWQESRNEYLLPSGSEAKAWGYERTFTRLPRELVG
jgi:hypothetical protein